jgi:hypothetical protein
MTKNYQKNTSAFSMRYHFNALYSLWSILKILSRRCNVVLRFVMSSIGSILREFGRSALSGAMFAS